MSRRKTRGYYDIDFEVDFDNLSTVGMLDEIFFLKDLQQRKLFLSVDIEDVTVRHVIKHIMQFNAEDRGIAIKDRKPILLYISSRGGDIDAGFELVDVIQNSKTPVYTVNLGYQYSMGFLVGLAGHKRFATTNAKYLMHDGTQFIYNSGMKAQDQMDFQRCTEERIKSYVVEHSKISPEEYDSKLRYEWYLYANEAKEKGFTDMIIGVDCDIDMIV